jgi:hypothetical protein
VGARRWRVELRTGGCASSETAIGGVSAQSRRVGPIARTPISMATASPPGPCAGTYQTQDTRQTPGTRLRQGSRTCSVRCASGEPKGPSDRVLHGRSQKTKAPRSARGAQQHPNSLANIVNRASHWASNAVGELTHSTASRRVGCREQKRPQLATTARGRVDVICDVLPESAFRHTRLVARHRAVELDLHCRYWQRECRRESRPKTSCG